MSRCLVERLQSRPIPAPSQFPASAPVTTRAITFAIHPNWKFQQRAIFLREGGLMAVVSLADMKAELGIIDDTDDTLITSKIDEAQAWLESFLGYTISEEFPDGVPPDIIMAVKLQAAHLFENREATAAGISIQLSPNGVDDVIRNRRSYAWE